VVVWLLREIGAKKMPEILALEKTKDQFSAKKDWLGIVSKVLDLGLTSCKIPLGSRLHLPNL
jgi:hypothetical protein